MHGSSARVFGIVCLLLAVGGAIGLSPAAARAQSEAASVETAEPSRWAEARELVARAEALFDVGNYEAVLVDYTRAYELLADYPRRSAVLHNLTLCNQRLFRYAEACSISNVTWMKRHSTRTSANQGPNEAYF